MKTILFLLSFTILSISAHATIWTVDSTNNAGYGSLRAAINSSSNGDVIRFNPILIASGSDSIVLDSSIVFSKVLTIVGLYTTIDTLFISGGGNDRIFNVDSTGNLTLDSLVLINGHVSQGAGGAILFGYSDSLFVLNSVLKNNSSQNGGAIYILQSKKLEIINSTVSNNLSSSLGGGGISVFHSGAPGTNVYLENTIVNNNTTNSGFGGGLYCLSSQGTQSYSATKTIIKNCQFNGNYSGDSGGGIYLYGSASSSNYSQTLLDMENTTVNGNNCLGNGGGIICDAAKDMIVNFNNCEFIGNSTSSGGYGGGVFLQGPGTIDMSMDSTIIDSNSLYSPNSHGGGMYIFTYFLNVTITNSSVSYNSCDFKGGGIYIDVFKTVTMNVNNSSFIGNVVSSGSGGGIMMDGHQVMLNLVSSRIQNNSAGDDGGGVSINGIWGAMVGALFSELNIEDSYIANNVADSNGGGIYSFVDGVVGSPDSNYSHVNVNSSTISGNIANDGNGGGIYSNTTAIPSLSPTESIINISRSSLDGNGVSSGFDGGAIYSYCVANASSTATNSIVNIENSTIINNLGDGISTFCLQSSTINTSGSILVNNGSPNLYNNKTPTFISGGYNIFSDSVLNGVLLSDSVNVNAAVLNLDTLAMNGGNTPTRIPLFPSIALNSGNPIDSIDAQNRTIVDTRDRGAGESCVSTTIDYQYTCDSLTWLDGVTYYSDSIGSTQYFINSEGCDSIVILHLDVLSDSIIDQITTCNSLTWIDGVTYTSSTNSPFVVYTNTNACDSVITLDLTINSSSFFTDTIVVCDSMTWINGVTYTSSNNTATDTLVNAIGCDSIVTLNLTVQNTTDSIEVVTACDSLTWIDGITYYSSNNTATDTLINSLGCDSIITLNLTINYSSVNVDTLFACDSLIWIDGITYYTSNNTATYTVVNSLGCDSTHLLNLTVSNLNANYTFVNNGNGSYSFTNSSTGNYSNSQWAFGDGITYSNTNSIHTYAANGNYVVVLAIFDSNIIGGSCISYFIDTIVVTGASNITQCNAGWAVFADSSTGGVTIVNSSTGTNLTYHWEFGDGDTSNLQFPSHTYATNGPFNLCLTVDDGNGCSDTYCDSISSNGVLFKNGFDLNVVDNFLVGIQNIENKNEIKIYPNPTSSTLNIETQDLKINKILIRDNSGKVVKTITSNFNVVNVENLATGVYHIELIGDEETVSKKFIKQ